MYVPVSLCLTRPLCLVDPAGFFIYIDLRTLYVYTVMFVLEAVIQLSKSGRPPTGRTCARGVAGNSGTLQAFAREVVDALGTVSASAWCTVSHAALGTVSASAWCTDCLSLAIAACHACPLIPTSAMLVHALAMSCWYKNVCDLSSCNAGSVGPYAETVKPRW